MKYKHLQQICKQDYANLYDDELEGGTSQECKIIDKIISQRSKELISPIFGEENVQINYDLTNIKRTDFPITLDPKTATFHDVAIHALLRQRLSQNTVKKRMSTAKFMETHTRPIDFRNPSYENFINHMDYREQIEKTGKRMENNENVSKSIRNENMDIQTTINTTIQSKSDTIPRPSVHNTKPRILKKHL